MSLLISPSGKLLFLTVLLILSSFRFPSLISGPFSHSTIVSLVVPVMTPDIGVSWHSSSGIYLVYCPMDATAFDDSDFSGLIAPLTTPLDVLPFSTFASK